MNKERSIVLALTGASAIQLGERAIELLLNNNLMVDVVLSKGAYKVAKSERQLNIPTEPVAQNNFWRKRFNTDKGHLTCHRWNDHSSRIASGSFATRAMVIVPCSMGTIGRISSGCSQGLIERCADVHLKEKRPLLISPRETPLNLIHLKNLTALAEAGASIVPPIPAWYSNPKSIDDLIDFMVVRLFDNLGENLANIERWDGPKG